MLDFIFDETHWCGDFVDFSRDYGILPNESAVWVKDSQLSEPGVTGSIVKLNSISIACGQSRQF